MIGGSTSTGERSTRDPGASAPRLTVIIPTHNRSRYVREAIDSVLTQDYRDFVLLVSDNASVDDTPSVVESYDDERLEYVRRSENIGWVRNFNAALAATVTELVTILNDDDLMRPGALARAVAAFDRHPTAGMVHTAFDVIGPAGELLEENTDWTHGLEGDTLEPGREFIRRSMEHFGRTCPPSVVLRASALPAVPYDPADEPMSNHPLELSVALRWDVMFLAASGVAFRYHDEMGSSSWGASSPGGVYSQRLDVILRMRDVKLRFIRTHASELGPDARGLRAAVRRYVDRELTIRAVAQGYRGRRGFFGTLVEGARVSPTLLLRGSTCRAAMRSMLGPALTRRIRRVLGRGGSQA